MQLTFDHFIQTLRKTCYGNQGGLKEVKGRSRTDVAEGDDGNRKKPRSYMSASCAGRNHDDFVRNKPTLEEVALVKSLRRNVVDAC